MMKLRTIMALVALASAWAITPAARAGIADNLRERLSPSPKIQESRPAAKGPDRLERLAKPEKSPASPDQIKKLLEEIKLSRAKFLQDQKLLQQQLHEATDEQRDQIRQELRDKREQFLEQQKDLRDEVLRRVNELKDQLKDRGDLVGTKGGKPQKSGGN